MDYPRVRESCQTLPTIVAVVAKSEHLPSPRPVNPPDGAQIRLQSSS